VGTLPNDPTHLKGSPLLNVWLRPDEIKHETISSTFLFERVSFIHAFFLSFHFDVADFEARDYGIFCGPSPPPDPTPLQTHNIAPKPQEMAPTSGLNGEHSSSRAV